MPSLNEIDILKNVDLPRVSEFEKTEFEDRLRKVRELMATRDIKLMILTNPNSIRYLTGYHTFGSAAQFLLVPYEGEMVHVLRFFESILAGVYSQVAPENVSFYEDTDDLALVLTHQRNKDGTALSLLDVVTKVVRDMGLDKAIVGCEGSHMTDMIKHRLAHPEHERLFEAAWRHLDGDIGPSMVESVRDIKSPAELAYMHEAGKISLAGEKSGLQAVRADITDNEVAAEITAALLRAGSERMDVFPIVTSGWRSGIPHTTFGRQDIREGDTVLMEFTGVRAGYVAPIMRTAVVGEPSSKIREMSDVVLEALQAAIKAMRPGATSGNVDDACRGVIEKAGYYDNFRKRTGYSVGLRWLEHLCLAKDDPTVLVPGMVFHLPVALRDYGKSAVGFSVTAAITEGEAEILTALPTGVVIKS